MDNQLIYNFSNIPSLDKYYNGYNNYNRNFDDKFNTEKMKYIRNCNIIRNLMLNNSKLNKYYYNDNNVFPSYNPYIGINKNLNYNPYIGIDKNLNSYYNNLNYNPYIGIDKNLNSYYNKENKLNNNIDLEKLLLNPSFMNDISLSNALVNENINDFNYEDNNLNQYLDSYIGIDKNLNYNPYIGIDKNLNSYYNKENKLNNNIDLEKLLLNPSFMNDISLSNALVNENINDFNYEDNNLNQYLDTLLLPELRQYNNNAMNESISTNLDFFNKNFNKNSFLTSNQNLNNNMEKCINPYKPYNPNFFLNNILSYDENFQNVYRNKMN
eukprot:jgi/Orpsp1_1/1187207/evm.model.d7180000056108.1